MFTKWIKAKINKKIIIAAAFIAVLSLIIVFMTDSKSKHPAYQEQLQAAQKMKKAEEVIYKAKIKRGYKINTKLDPNKTALIGEEYTPITTTLGNLKAKRTASNPDFAALIYRYFYQLNLKENDVIAVGASGSFPGLLLAVLSAAETMNLRPLLIYSIGSSMYGANLPDYTFIQMLEELQKRKILKTKIIAVSFGGDNDRADNLLLGADKTNFYQIAAKSNLPLIYADNLTQSIDQRMDYYQKKGDKKIKCFVNIGGASANFGNTMTSVKFDNGLTIASSLESDYTKNGLIFRFLAKNVPVIHLLNIENLARKNGVQVDPVPLPEAGEADVYYIIEHNRSLIIFLILIICSPLAAALILKYK